VIAGLKNDRLLPRMMTSLWGVVNTPPANTREQIATQQHALRLLLETRGGVEFVLARPKEEQEELRRRGVWDGPIIIRELAGLELKRRRLLVALADIDSRSRQILKDLKLGGSEGRSRGENS
jgi:hypothetical protein